jgi:RHS repeat-associated protein
MTSFGETADKNAFFTGKPMIDELGYSFLFRDYNPHQGKWTTSDPLGYPDGWNNLAYVNNRASNCFDFAGAWLEAAHHSINARWLESNSSFISSATNFKWGEYNSFNIVAIFNAASDWTDSSPNQSDDKAYMHAMRSENDSYQDASSRYYNYLNQLENLARYTSDLARKAYMEGNYSAATSWMNSALNYLGCLVHTYSDSFSPSHAGFQHFTYWNAPEHLYNERDSVYQTWSSNITSGLNISYGSLLKFVLKQPE